MSTKRLTALVIMNIHQNHPVNYCILISCKQVFLPCIQEILNVRPKKNYSCFRKCGWRKKSSPGRLQIFFFLSIFKGYPLFLFSFVCFFLFLFFLFVWFFLEIKNVYPDTHLAMQAGEWLKIFHRADFRKKDFFFWSNNLLKTSLKAWIHCEMCKLPRNAHDILFEGSRTISPEEHCPLDNCPPDNSPLHDCPLPPRGIVPRTIAPDDNCPQGKLPPGQLPPRKIPPG